MTTPQSLLGISRIVCLGFILSATSVWAQESDTLATQALINSSETPPVKSTIPPARPKKLVYELSGQFNRVDSLEKRMLQKQQTRIRAQIDILSTQLVWISEKLQDPRTRIALAKKISASISQATLDTLSQSQVTKQELKPVSVQMIDRAAVPLIRSEGLSLDQARLHIIESLTQEQVLSFYRDLPRSERYKLYDMIDGAMQSDGIEFDLARKSAIFFYLYAQ